MVRSIIGEVTSYYPFSAYQVKTDGVNWNTRKPQVQLRRGYRVHAMPRFTGCSASLRKNNITLTWLLSDQVNSTTVTASALTGVI